MITGKEALIALANGQEIEALRKVFGVVEWKLLMNGLKNTVSFTVMQLATSVIYLKQENKDTVFACGVQDE